MINEKPLAKRARIAAPSMCVALSFIVAAGCQTGVKDGHPSATPASQAPSGAAAVPVISGPTTTTPTSALPASGNAKPTEGSQDHIPSLAARAAVVMRVRLIEYQGGSKWHFSTVQPLRIIKNTTGRTISGPQSVGALFWGGDPPQGQSTLYLNPYGQGWALVDGNASAGVSHAQSQVKAAPQLLDAARAAQADVVLRGEVTAGATLHADGWHGQGVSAQQVLKNNTSFFFGGGAEVAHHARSAGIAPGKVTVYLKRANKRWELLGGTAASGTSHQVASASATLTSCQSALSTAGYPLFPGAVFVPAKSMATTLGNGADTMEEVFEVAKGYSEVARFYESCLPGEQVSNGRSQWSQRFHIASGKPQAQYPSALRTIELRGTQTTTEIRVSCQRCY